MVIKTQQKNNQDLNTNNQLVKIVNNFQNRKRSTIYKQKRQDFDSNTNAPDQYKLTSISAISGQCRTYNHSLTCPARD